MRRRSRVGLVKPRRRKPAPKRASGTEAARPPSAAGQESEIARVKRELSEARHQQIAAADVLRLISSSPGELRPVFQAILENATRICEAKFGNLWLREGNGFRIVETHGAPLKYREYLESEPLVVPEPESAMARIARAADVVQIDDITVAPTYGSRMRTATIELAKARTLVGAPMLKEGKVVGIVAIYRQEVRRFSDEQIALVQNFAAQAAIAIENARLLNELRESLDRQTATTDILRVIAGTPEDSKRALDTIAETASRMFDSAIVNFRRLEGDVLRVVSSAGLASRIRQALPDIPLEPTDPAVRSVLDNQQIPIEDRQASLPSERGEIARLLRGLPVRSQVFTPLSREGKAIGVMIVSRDEVRPFQKDELELMKGFADQAVIAIENARLLSELRLRTADLSESLEQQTATSDVLRVISSSQGELEPIFRAMLENAVRICDARFGNLLLASENGMRIVAMHNAPPAFAELRRSDPFIDLAQSFAGPLVTTKRLIHLEDLAASEAHATSALAKIAGARTALAVPMLREDALVGAITIYRQDVRPFSDKQIELIKNFAAQAVIAIENARLLSELRQRTADLSESLEQQIATADVLRIISSSPGELKPVFQGMLENAVRICEARFGFMLRYDGDAYQTVAELCDVPAYVEEMKRGPLKPHPESALGCVARTRQVAQIADITAHRLYAERNPLLVTGAELGGIRTIVAVPMLKDQQLIGAITIFRQEVRPFTDKQIALVQNFAAQAVIAIENARLLGELRQRTEEVVKLNQQLEQRVADQVSEIERMGRLRRFLPPQVADLIVASGAEQQLESHRQEVTALFCDLRGFTGFSESSDPEDVMALLAQYHAAIGEIIIKYSGTLERYAGDGVMVIFNDPVPVENPALQAVLMALDMRAAIGGLIEKWRDLGHDLGFGIGIAHGFATLGTIGFEGRRDYAAIGTVSNVASRLCDEAKPGQILISPRVRQAVEKAVTVVSVGEFALKGIRRPMAAYNVLAPSDSKSN
jgi:GAF domain-containing protein